MNSNTNLHKGKRVYKNGICLICGKECDKHSFEIKTLFDYVNCWASSDEHCEYAKNNRMTEWGIGYNQAVSDIWEKLKELYPTQ